MKKINLMEVNSVVVKGFMAMLALLTLLVPALLGASQANAQEKRGRMVDPTRQFDAQQAQISEPRTVTLSLEASEALAGILNTQSSDHDTFDKRILRFDVSENARGFIFDETPLHPHGMPAYGNEFVTEGYIYPYGTLNGANGVKDDKEGSPEFPEKVIGRWTCRGWHVGEGAKTVTGPWVVTHQLYDFGPEAGRVTLTTDGVELVDIDVPVMRAVVGGTGPFSNVKGEARQTMIGFNQINGVNLRLEIRVAKR
jgi:hypothetical protein